MAHRVVITGIGPVTSAGSGADAFFKNVWSRHCPARQIPEAFSRSHPLRSKWYVPLPEVSLADCRLSAMHEQAMQAADRLVVLAAKLAFEDAGYRLTQEGGRMAVPAAGEVSTILGTGLGGLQAALDSYLAHCLPEAVLPAAPEKRVRFNRMVVPKTMPNSPAAWASICFGLTGACQTINASCASGTCAIGEAFRRIKDGYDTVALTGGVDALPDATGFMMRGFDVLGALTQSPDGRPRPFGKGRSGFLFAEGGACVLVLENLEHALRRRARIYAEIADFRSNSEASSIVQIDPEGKQITRLLRELSAGRRIDYLNTHGTGTQANDAVEAQAIRTVYGEAARQPWINSTKGILGHTLGASGAIEAAATALSIARGAVHGNLTEDPLEDLNLPLQTITAPIRNAISVSYGFGGHNGGLLLTNFESHG